MAQAFLFLIDGFEEIEALATVDILRRGGVDVTMVSLTENKVVNGSHGIAVVSDALFSSIEIMQADILIIPGGTVAYNEHEAFKQALLGFSDTGKPIAAICAAPMVLGGLSLLEGKRATCYPGFEKYLKGADVQENAAVVSDGNIITAKGPGFALDFALSILEKLMGKDARNKIANDLLLS